jgi:hypothetical protein
MTWLAQPPCEEGAACRGTGPGSHPDRRFSCGGRSVLPARVTLQHQYRSAARRYRVLCRRSVVVAVVGVQSDSCGRATAEAGVPQRAGDSMVGPTPNVPDGDISETPSCTVSMRSLTVQQPGSACHQNVPPTQRNSVRSADRGGRWSRSRARRSQGGGGRDAGPDGGVPGPSTGDDPLASVRDEGVA